MPAPSTAPYPFGDLLALTRQSWITELTRRLEVRGYPGYRRTDSASVRMLFAGALAIGQLGTRLGVTRQAARKVADGLQGRGYATTGRDERDSRQLNIALTAAGQEYARAIVIVIRELNREVSMRVDPAQLAAADAVLRAALFDDSARRRAGQLRGPGPAAPDPDAPETDAPDTDGPGRPKAGPPAP
jgi:DNA-binding MarR family transcriptional regulator